MEKNELVSVGIDIGTVSINIVLTSICLSDGITKRRILYESSMLKTPYRKDGQLDENTLLHLIDIEYNAIGVTKEHVKCGIVIMTGRARKTTNAETALATVCAGAGSSIAGSMSPMYAAYLAGVGSGACRNSSVSGLRVLNIDIGGGTTKLAFFENGNYLAGTSLDIGTHSIAEDNGKITAVDDRMSELSQKLRISVKTGRNLSSYDTFRLTSTLSDLIFYAANENTGGVKALLFGSRTDEELARSLLTDGCGFPGADRMPPARIPADMIMFSGGGARLIKSGWGRYRYHDIGDALGESILRCVHFPKKKWKKLSETVNATALGASMYTLQTGRLAYKCGLNLLPLSDLHVFYVSDKELSELVRGDSSHTSTALFGFLGTLKEPRKFAFSFDTSTLKKLEDQEISCESTEREVRSEAVSYAINTNTAAANLAKSLISLTCKTKYRGPLVIVTEGSGTGCLGEALHDTEDAPSRIICLTGIKSGSGDLLEIGESFDGCIAPVTAVPSC